MAPRKRKIRPLCKDHWQQMRKEAFAVIPAWSRPLAGFKVNRVLREKGFVKATDEPCAFCGSGEDKKGKG